MGLIFILGYLLLWGLSVYRRDRDEERRGGVLLFLLSKYVIYIYIYRLNQHTLHSNIVSSLESLLEEVSPPIAWLRDSFPFVFRTLLILLSWSWSLSLSWGK